MGVFDFVKNAGRAIGIGDDKETAEEQDRRAAAAKTASQAARERARREEAEAAAKKAKSDAKEAAEKVAAQEPEISEATLQSKIETSKIDVKDLSLKVEKEEDKVKVYGVVKSPEDKADLILLVGNTPGVAKVEDAIKVRKPGAEKAEEDVPTPRFHQVKSGETLSSIAQKELGDANRYMEIFNANRNLLHDPDQIDVGQTLRIPTK